MLTNAVNSCGLEISFGSIAPFDSNGLVVATGVFSLSFSLDLAGVAGTFKGSAVDMRENVIWADGCGNELRVDLGARWRYKAMASEANTSK